jgi:hypothetical protein
MQNINEFDYFYHKNNNLKRGNRGHPILFLSREKVSGKRGRIFILENAGLFG